ncbi:phage tail tape measure protein [Cellulosimicrobium sp. ES-005]|uniref:Phage tail tape measure protein n=1 Tax=Cellulosimicrobium sp. ES-005 TaxID=3163031 RepID=A0AAU8G0P9_9MICO
MADRIAAIRLALKTEGFVAGAKTAQQAMKDLGTKGLDYVASKEQHIGQVSNTLGALGLAAVGATTLAVAKFADFDAAMSSVRAATMASASEMEALREAAIQAGADTAFSATEAAAAIENLSKAGVSTADILGGALTGSLDLAAAGELDVASAAEIAATAMTQFGLSGEDVTHIADLLAAGAGKAQGDVTDLAQALNQSGLVASQFGLSIEETTGTLSAFASAGLLGSDAGTSFKTMLLALANPSEKSAKTMRDLGIAAYDAQGNFVGITNLAGQLETALAPLPQAQRDAAMATIFGSDAIRSANVLYQQGADGIQGWVDAVNDQGYAAEQAAMRLDNLKGDLEGLSGSIETAFIKSGSGANDVLRGLVQGADSVVDAIGQIPAPVLSATTAFVGTGGLVTLGIAGLMKFATFISDTKTALGGLNISMKTAGIGAGALGAAIGAAAIGLTIWAQNAAEAKARTDEYMGTLDELGKRTDQTLSRINDALSQDRNDWLDNLFGKDAESLIDRAERVGVAVEDLQGYILGNEDAIRRVTAATREYVASGDEVMTQGEINAAASRLLTGALDEESRALTDAEKQAAQKKLADDAAGVAQEDLASTYSATTSEVVNQTTALADLISAQQEAAGVVLSERDAQRQLEQAIADANTKLSENGATLDITTQKGRDNQAALDDIASSTWDVIAAMQKNGADQTSLQAVMQTSRDRFLGVAQAAGMSADEANGLADELGLIPAQVQTNIRADTGQAMSAIENLKAAYASIKDRTIEITTAFKETGIRPPAGYYVPSGERASGGPVTGGQTYLVGENGPELFTAPATGMITNSAATRAIGAVGAVPGVPYSNSNPAPSAAGGQQTPTAVYVQNPFTGEYLLAEVSTVARSQATSAIRTSQSRRAAR